MPIEIKVENISDIDNLLETHYEVVAAIEFKFQPDYMEQYAEVHKNLYAAYEKGGIGFKWELANELVTKFNQKYASENWDETNWFETVGLFVDEEIRKLSNETVS